MLATYKNKIDKGLATVVRIDEDNFAVCVKQFSQEDGSELPSQVVGITLAEIDNEIGNLTARLDTLNELKKSISLLKVSEIGG